MESRSFQRESRLFACKTLRKVYTERSECASFPLLLQLFPAVLFQINLAFAIEFDAFLFQPRALLVIPIRRTYADLALRVHHAMPRYILVARAHCPADRTRGTRRPQRLRDLSIGCYFATRDFADESVNALEEGIGRGGTRENANIMFHYEIRPAQVAGYPGAKPTLVGSKAGTKGDFAFVLPRIHSPGAFPSAFKSLKSRSNAA